MQDRTIGKYRLDGTLGVGTVGTVYRATNVESGEEVALKVLSPDVSHDPLITARFKREMDILSRLNHPNMVRNLDGGKHGEQLYYAMEYLPGGTVRQLIEVTGPFSWQETAECGRQIAAALQHAHNNNIIHRDLKPSNLFITDDGKLRLGDFGIARDLKADDLTLAGVTVGTYAYIAPEQIRGERDISGKSDLYSLGCVMFQMLTGRVPFDGNDFSEIVQQQLHADPPSLKNLVPDCPDELARIIRQLMEKDPAQRPFNARTVQGTLDNLLRNRIPDYRPHPTPSDGGDVAAAAVPDLRHRLDRRRQVASEVSWSALVRLAAVILCLLVMIVIANAFWAS